MWVGDTIFYNSDRDGHFNLYSYTVSSGKTNQVTHSKLWDVRWPSSDHEGRVIYEMNGELQVLETRSGKSSQISINVPDDGLSRRPSRISAANNIESFELSPQGERALFCPRRHLPPRSKKDQPAI
jgi:tricorn protease